MSAWNNIKNAFLKYTPLGWKYSLFGKLFGKNGGLNSMFNSITGSALTPAQREANSFEAQQAQNQMDFQERMSNTEYQRGVADMKAAGINPALMYGNGANGASTPSGAMAASESPGIPDVVGLMTALSNLSLLKAQRDNIRSQTKEREQNIEESKSRVKINELAAEYYPALTEGQLSKISAEISKFYSSSEVDKHNVAYVDAQTALAETRNFVEKLQADWVDRLNEAKTDEAKANVARAFAAAAYDNYFISYGKSHGGQLPGYNQALGIASAIQDVFGKVLGYDSDLDLAKLIGDAIFKSGGR